MTRKLSDSHYVNNQKRMQEILQEQVRKVEQHSIKGIEALQ